ncbi:hypothetical protein ACH5AJ_36515 [Streptomyces rochei]|uniref:hypothetical protein n=1 Tax=Streptomyces rochei TaxID=1928 RepID=UPI0037AB7CAC
MSQVRKYRVTHNGHKTIMRLNDTDVKLYPDAELVEDTTTGGDTEPAPKAATGKTRTAADKSRSAGGDKSAT